MPSFTRKRLIAVFVFCCCALGAFANLGPVGRADTEPALPKQVATVDGDGAVRNSNLPDRSQIREMQISYRGAPDVVDAMRSGEARSRTLASGDLNGDAAPDLISGYSWNGVGIVTVQRGNTDAYAPTDDSVFERMHDGYNPDSLVAEADAYQVSASADLLEAGDFNHDNCKDILVAARDGGLYLLAGDGQGGFLAAESIDLPGTVTAMTAGEFRAADGWSDAAVAINGPDGPKLLIYDESQGVGGVPLSFRLDAPATGLQIDEFDNDPYRDIAVAAGSQIEIIHGWGRKQNADPNTRVERIGLGYNAHDLATGFFVWNRAAVSEIAVRSDDGTIRILVRGTDERPFNEAELRSRARKRTNLTKETIDIEDVPAWRPGMTPVWRNLREFATNEPGSGDEFGNIFQRSHISFGQMDDLLIADGNADKLDVLSQSDDKTKEQTWTGDLVSERLETGNVPAAVLVLPQKLNGERSMIVMHAGRSLPSVVPLAPTATIIVDRTDDPAITTSGTGAAACTAAANDCSLRGAVQFANANPGTTISLGTATYTLNINGTGGCVTEDNVNGNRIGDLEMNETTTVTGTGQASTIIRQLGTGDGGTHPGDRVICMDVPLAPGRTWTFSGLTISGGRDANTGMGNGGGGFLGGAKATTLTITNVTFANNQASGAGFGGGGATVTGGNMNVTNCTFGAANLPGPSRTDLTLGNAAGTSGGALAYTSGDPAGSSGALGTLTVIGTTFTHNTSASGGSGGGGLDIFGLNLSAPTVSVSTTIFSNNQANNTASGGAMINEGGNVTVASTSFTSNSALNRGGAIYAGGGSTLLDGTSPSITFTGNTAVSGGSSISTAAPFNVQGTNTTIGGSIEITLGGIWTNTNTGSALNPTDIVIAGGIMTCNNSTMNVTGNIALGPSGNGLVGGTFNGNTGTVNLSGNLTTNTGGSGPSPSFTGNNFNFIGSGAESSVGTLSPTFNNLTVNKTNTLTLGVNSAVTGNLTLTAGTFDLGAFTVNRSSAGGSLTVSNGTTLKVGGTNTLPSNYSTHSVGTTSTIEYSGTNQTVATLNSSQNYGNLIISGSGTKTLQGAISVITHSTINGGTLDVSASNFGLNISGDFTNNVAAANFNPRGGTVTFNGGGGQIINGTAASQTFNNLIVNKGGGALATGGSTATLTSNDLTMTAGTFSAPATMNINSNTLLSAGTFNAGTTINSLGNWTNNGGVFTPGTGTINFASSAANQRINGSAASQTFNNVTVNKTGRLLDTGGSTTSLVTSNLTMTAGAFTAPATLDINGNALLSAGTLTAGTTITAAGDWTNNGATFTPGGGTVTFDGSGAQNLNGSAATQSFNNFTVDKSGGALTGGGTTATLNLAGSVTLQQGTFAAGTLTAIGLSAGNWTNNGATFTPASSVVSFTNTTGAQAINGLTTLQNFNGITIAKTAQILSVSGNTTSLDLTGTMLITSGTMSATAATITVMGDWTNNGGAFVPGAGTVIFSGNAAQNLNGSSTTQTFNHFTVNKTGGALTGGGGTTTLSVGGSLAITSGTFASGSITGLNVAGNWTNNGTFTAGASNTVTFNGANSNQTLVGTTTFNNLTSSHVGTGGVSATGSSLTVLGLLRVLSGTFTSSSSFNNVQIDVGTTLASDGNTMNVSGNWTNNGGTFTANGGTVNFNGVSAQAIGGTAAAQTFNNLTVNKTAGALSVGGSTVTLNVTGNATLTAGTFTAGTANPINIGGNWANSAAFTAGTGTVAFNGSSAQTISGASATTFNGLTLNNAAGLTLNLNTAFNGALTLSNGVLNTGANTLSAGASGTATRTNGFVIGTIQKTFGAAGAFLFPVGTLNGYSPVGTNVTAGTGSLTVTAVQGVQPNIPFPTHALLRYWTLTGSGITADLTFNYLDPTDIPGTATEANFVIQKYNGSFIQPGGSVNTVANTASITGVTSFSDWTLAEPSAFPTPTATNTPTSTPTATSTPTNTATPTATGTPAITGIVTYGNAVSGPTPPRFVSNVLISGAGSPNVSTTTAAPGGTAGQYSLTGFGSGSYTVTPTKTGGENGGITSFDAARISQHAAGTSLLTGNQLIVADVSGNGAITSFDASEVANFVVTAIPAGSSGTWRFIPVSMTYPTVTTLIAAQDYSALLMGEVSGNWTNTGARPDGDRQSQPAVAGNAGPERSTALIAPHLVTPAGYEIVIPISVEGAEDKGIISYEFDLRYDPSVIRPQASPVDIVGTASRALSAAVNADEPGLLRVAVYGPTPLGGNGILLNLKFIAVGAPGSVSPLTWQRSMVNEGDPQTTSTDGQVQLSTAAPNQAEIGGRLLDPTGQGIPNALVTLTDSTGKERSVLSNGFGVYRFGALQVGQTYTLGAGTKRFAVKPLTVSVTDQVVSVDMLAEQ